MKSADTTADIEIIPPELVDDEPAGRESGGLVLPIVGMVLALMAAWLVLTMTGILGEKAEPQSASPVIQTSSCC